MAEEWITVTKKYKVNGTKDRDLSVSSIRPLVSQDLEPLCSLLPDEFDIYPIITWSWEDQENFHSNFQRVCIIPYRWFGSQLFFALKQEEYGGNFGFFGGKQLENETIVERMITEGSFRSGVLDFSQGKYFNFTFGLGAFVPASDVNICDNSYSDFGFLDWGWVSLNQLGILMQEAIAHENYEDPKIFTPCPDFVRLGYIWNRLVANFDSPAEVLEKVIPEEDQEVDFPTLVSHLMIGTLNVFLYYGRTGFSIFHRRFGLWSYCPYNYDSATIALFWKVLRLHRATVFLAGNERHFPKIFPCKILRSIELSTHLSGKRNCEIMVEMENQNFSCQERTVNAAMETSMKNFVQLDSPEANERSLQRHKFDYVELLNLGATRKSGFQNVNLMLHVNRTLLSGWKLSLNEDQKRLLKNLVYHRLYRYDPSKLGFEFEPSKILRPRRPRELLTIFRIQK